MKPYVDFIDCNSRGQDYTGKKDVLQRFNKRTDCYNFLYLHCLVSTETFSMDFLICVSLCFHDCGLHLLWEDREIMCPHRQTDIFIT